MMTRKKAGVLQREDREVDPRVPMNILSGGAGRGARGMLEVISDFNRISKRTVLRPHYDDPAPGKAEQVAIEALGAGVPAGFKEAGIEEVVTEQADRETGPLVLQLDRPSAIATAIRSTIGKRRAVVGYLLVRLPDGQLVGIRWAVQAHEDDVKRQLADFFDDFATVAARNGSDWVVGDRALPEHLVMEPAIRSWFGEHLTRVVPKVVAGLEPECDAVEMTFDGGQTALPVILRRANGSRSNLLDLAANYAYNPDRPVVRRGTEFCVASHEPGDVRFPRFRLRASDGKLSIQGVAAVDPRQLDSMSPEDRARVSREIENATRRIEQQKITRSMPAMPTD